VHNRDVSRSPNSREASNPVPAAGGDASLQPNRIYGSAPGDRIQVPLPPARKRGPDQSDRKKCSFVHLAFGISSGKFVCLLKGCNASFKV
jgi:hypothetical protein